MSEFIQKFRPPTISKWDLEQGTRYAETPQQKDWLGQDINVGDIVLYVRATGTSAELSVAKVVGMYTKISPKYSYTHTKETVESTTVSIVTKGRWDSKLRRTGTTASKLLKLHPSQYTDKVTKEIIEA